MAGALLPAALMAWLWTPPADAQRLPIAHYSTRDGLPHYVVNRIVRDSRGFLWFCTREGFARFDGREFVRFGTEQGLPRATVNDLVEARDGTFWIATAAGLAHFDPRRLSSFTTYLAGPDRRAASVNTLALDPSGDVWVGTAAGLYRVRVTPPNGVQLSHVRLDVPGELPAGGIGSLLVDRTGALWIGAGGGLYRRTGEYAVEAFGEAEGLPPPPIQISDMLEDRAGRIWLATTTGLHLVEAAGPDGRRRVNSVAAEKAGLPRLSMISSLLEDSRGLVWAGTNKGLVRIAPGGDAAVAGLRVIAEDEGLPGHEIQGLAEDTHGNLWVGVVPFGAVRLSSEGFTSFELPAPQTFPSTLLEPADEGLVAIGLSAGHWAVSRFDGERFRPIPGARPEGTPSWGWNQLALRDRSGVWWFGTNEGVLRYRQGLAIDDLARARPVARYTRTDGLAADVVIRLFEDARGDIWISTVGHGVRPNGLSVWRQGPSPGLVHFSERDGLPALDQFYVSSFATDRAGHLWIGLSGDAGLLRYDGRTFTRFTARDGVPPGQVRNLLADSRGRLWAATYRGGLCRIDHPETAKPQFHAYTTADGLSSNETHALVEGQDGDLYVGTARGIDRLAATTGRWSHYTSHDGLPAGEMQGALRDRQGALWFAYNAAVLRLVPAPERSPLLPRVFIDAIDVAGRPHPISAVGEQAVGPLVVPSGATIRVGFAAPWFGAPGDIAYQYRLQGADQDWLRPTDTRSTSYASVAPGTYTFMVRATADGIAGLDVATVSLTVVPPVWRRLSFLLPAGCVATLLVYAAYRVRLRRMLEFANMRTRIATDLHDDIGANLTRIGILSEVVRHQSGARDPVEDSRLASIARLARESVGAMSDIVWAINPERDTLVDLARKIRDVSEGVAAASELEVDVSLPDATANLRLDMDVRRDLFLICKEALTNAARHARCRHLRVSLRNAGGVLTLEVVDDGAGFDPARGYEGNGLISMRRRAERIGAALAVQSAPGRGTAVRVELPSGRRGRPLRPTPRGR